MSTHQELDEKRLALAKVKVKKMVANPHLFDEARAYLPMWKEKINPESIAYIKEWEIQFAKGMDSCLSFYVAETDKGTAFRQMDPFFDVLTEREKLDFSKNWNIKKYGDAGVFGMPKPENTKMLDLSKAIHLLGVVSILPNEIQGLYILGDYPFLIKGKEETVSSTDRLLLGTFEIEKHNKGHWLNIGKNSPIHTLFGYYPELIDMNNISLKEGWKSRITSKEIGRHTLNVLNTADLPSNMS